MEQTEKNYNRRDALKYLGKIAGAAVIPLVPLVLSGCASSRTSPGIYGGDGKVEGAVNDGTGISYGDYAKNFYKSEFGSVNPNPTPEEVKQAYLKYGFMEYPGELNRLSNKLGKDGKILESIVTRGGWALAVVNDAVEYPLAAIGGFFGGAFGRKGKQDMINFTRYLADGTIGGKTYNEFHKELLSLHGKGAMSIVHDSEPTKGGRAGKLIVIGASDALAIILPFIHHGHHHGAGAGAGPGSTPGDPF